MRKSSRLTAAPFVVLLALMTGCSMDQTQAPLPPPEPTPSLSTEPVPTPVASTVSSPLPSTDPFQDASDKAAGAEAISKSAQSRDDWNTVAGMWQEAVKLLRAVPESSSKYKFAQKKIKEYQQNLNTAQQNTKKGLSPSLVVAQQTYDSSSDSKLNPTETMQAFVEQYFNATINKGSKGYEYWCSDFTRPDSAISPVSIIAPRSWTLLNIELESRGANRKDGRGDFIGSITVRVESSNRLGTPIVNNWSFNVVKEVPKLKNTFPGRYCISALSSD